MPEIETKPNKAMETTPVAVTPCAVAQGAPSTFMADLKRSSKMKMELQVTPKLTALEIVAVAFSCAGAFTYIILPIIGVILAHLAQMKKKSESPTSGILITALVVGYFGIGRGILKFLDHLFT